MSTLIGCKNYVCAYVLKELEYREQVRTRPNTLAESPKAAREGAAPETRAAAPAKAPRAARRLCKRKCVEYFLRAAGITRDRGILSIGDTSMAATYDPGIRCSPWRPPRASAHAQQQRTRGWSGGPQPWRRGRTSSEGGRPFLKLM